MWRWFIVRRPTASRSSTSLAAGDHSPAACVKLARLREIATWFPIALLVDDDEQVVSAVRFHDPPLVERVVLADWQQEGSRRTLRGAQQVDGRT